MHPDRAALVAQARALGPRLRARAAAANEARRLPAETIEDLRPLLKLVQPARYGGLEADPGTFFEVQIALAEACPSTAWVYGVVGIHPWQLALFPPAAQEEVWGDDPDTLLASSYMPVGKVTPVEGGFRLSGRWAYSSGVDHCQWALLGAFVPGSPPDMRTFLVPRSSFRVEDTWRVSGLRATGSNDVVVEDQFVPEHRTHRLVDGFLCRSPGNEVNRAPLYRLPFGQIFVRSVSTTAIGIAEGALAAYRAAVSGAITRLDAAKLAEDPTAQLVCAHARATLREVRLVLHANCEAMMAYAHRGEPIPVEERLVWRYDSARAVRRSVEVVEELFHATAARGLALDSPLQGAFQDAQAARAHHANGPDKPAKNLGGVLLGLRNQDYFV